VTDDRDPPGSPDTKTSRPTTDLVPPASSRQPRSIQDELPLDDGLEGILDPDVEPAPESEERPPASRKVASVRGTDAHADAHVEDFSTWEIDGITAEPPPTRKAGAVGGERNAKPDEPRVLVERAPRSARGGPNAAEYMRRALPERLIEIGSAARASRSPTFGSLLDASLSLGGDDVEEDDV